MNVKIIAVPGSHQSHKTKVITEQAMINAVWTFATCWKSANATAKTPTNPKNWMTSKLERV